MFALNILLQLLLRKDVKRQGIQINERQQNYIDILAGSETSK